jgi:hypothetical protein
LADCREPFEDLPDYFGGLCFRKSASTGQDDLFGNLGFNQAFVRVVFDTFEGKAGEHLPGGNRVVILEAFLPR